MKITEIPTVGLDHVSSSYKTKNGVGVCFFDPVEEVLIEFNETTKIPVYPTESCYRRFYIVKDSSDLKYNIVSLRAFSNSTDYIVKSVTDESSDLDLLPDGNVLIEFFSSHASGIIPFTLYIESTTTRYLEANISIELEVT